MRHFCLVGLLLFAAACDDPQPTAPICAQVTCDPLATCSDASGGARCICPAGYADTNGNGTVCTDVDECAAGTHTCDAHAKCTNTKGAFTCACDAGYTGGGMTCAACTACAAGTHETGACSAGADRVCSACTSCLATQYESGACTATSDRVCTACAAVAHCAGAPTCTTAGDQQCAACSSNFYLVDGAADTCAACSVGCPSGQYQSAACGAASDRVCSACTAIAHCAAAPTCSSASTQQCAACDPSFYLVNGVADTCAACSGTCPGGQYQSAACGATTDRVCSNCAVCSSGTYQATACTPTSDTVCTACTAIAHCAGAATCTTASDQQCAACSANFYLVDGPADTCAPCSVGCPSGQYQSAACAATTDRVCTACTSIAHCAAAPTCSSASNQQCTGCDPSFYLVNGAADSCAACSGACPGGQYQSAACGATTDRACSNCTVCSNGTYQATACTPTSDTVCTACPTHCTSCTSAAACSACDPGYFGATCQSVRADCYGILTNGGSSGDGLYTVDPDGAGGVAAMQVYCDMTNGGWTLINDQDVALGYLAAATWLAGVSTTAPNGGQWGILNRLSLFANTGGGFEFRLTFEQAQTSYVQWKQAADPLSGAAGTLTNVVMSPTNQMGCSFFLGLAARSSFAALDGDTAGCWWFAVGSSVSYVGPPGIPAYVSSSAGQLVTDRARLWVRKNGP